MKFFNFNLLIWLSGALLQSQVAMAHDFKLGHLTIDHPYATPTVAMQSTGAVYIRNLRNRGTTPDRLIAAQTPASARVGLHRMQMEGDVMRMREISAIDLSAKSNLQMGHASADGYHLMKSPTLISVTAAPSCQLVPIWVRIRPFKPLTSSLLGQSTDSPLPVGRAVPMWAQQSQPSHQCACRCSRARVI